MAKRVFKIIAASICSIKFPFLRFFIEHFINCNIETLNCHNWTGGSTLIAGGRCCTTWVNGYVRLLLLNLVASLKSLIQKNVASLSIFCWHFFEECSFEVADLVPLSHFHVSILVVLADRMIFMIDHHY